MAIYEMNGQQYEIPDEVQGDQLEETLTQLSEQTPAQQTQQPTEQEIREKHQRVGGLAEAIIEPVAAITGGIVGTVAGGLAGLPELAMGDPKASEETIKKVQQAVTEFTAPRTKVGELATETIGTLVEKGIDVLNIPLSGLSSIVELITGQGHEQATKTIESVQEIGLPRTAGKRVMEETGDPLLATIAEVSPEIVASLIPISRMAKKRSGLKAKLAEQVKASRANPELANKIKSLPRDASIVDKLDDMYGEIRTQSGKAMADKVAGISDDIKSGKIDAVKRLDDIADEIAQAQPQKALVKYTVDGAGKLKNDALAQKTIKQGFDAGTVSAISSASLADKAKMAKMVDVMKKGKENALFAVKNRPSDIAGDSLLERVKYVKNINREAGSQLNDVAKSLKGKPVNFDQPIKNFMNNLDDMGVTIEKLTPKFKGSDIEGLAGPETAVKNIIKRLTGGIKGKMPDAHELHRMKKYIDENVTYGKTGEGLKGKTERILKQLRRDLDDTLDTNFPEYDSVNTRYADTVSSLDALQDVAGRKMDLFGPNADKATGTLLRRLMSNAQSRINLADAVDSLETIAKKYGAVFDDDISTQMLFADELDSVFGPVARTSLAGETAKGFKKGAEIATGQKTAAGMAVETAAAAAEKLRGINEANAFKSITELLNRKD